MPNVDSMHESERDSVDRRNPQTSRHTLPRHYHDNADVPHVLARVRAFQRFFRLHVDGKYPAVYVELYSAALCMLTDDLAPYALDLALALITLEDEAEDGERD
ncbi:MAG TPA: hypothetical protein VJV97_04230 [Gemmatimonadaceae bacterium]|nr:hypothetical protein [Gemmatimonadaceae bacterium]